MPINLFYELKKYEDISYADPLRPKSGGSRLPLIDAHAVPVHILAKKFVITQMGISYTRCRNPPLLS